MSKIVKKKYAGKIMKVIYDFPCDRCNNYQKCKKEYLQCKAFKEYYNFGWYDIYKVGTGLKKIPTPK